MRLVSGPPVVLERVSNRIRELESLYASRCGGSDCALSYEEVKEVWYDFCPSVIPLVRC